MATQAELLQAKYAEERSARMKQRAAAMLSEEMPDVSAPQGSIRERYQLSPAREVRTQHPFHPSNCDLTTTAQL